MVSAKAAILTVLNIDHATSSDNWGAYDRTTVSLLDRDDYSGSTQANYDNVLVQGTKKLTGYPSLCDDVVDADEVVRVDIRSVNKTRIETLKDKVISILHSKRKTLTSPWHYMQFIDRGNNLSRGKQYRYVIELRLYVVDEILT